jgi:endo-1,4-beta-mannosidase
MGANVEVIRFWAFQRFITVNGQRDWYAFDTIIAKAKAANKRLMFTLTDHWGACESQGGERQDQWYTTGYKTDLRGDLTTYRNYVSEVVNRYKNENTIMMWQMVNEAETGCGSWTILRDFAADIGGLIKSIDANHIVSLGTIGGGQCGTSGADYKSLHAIPQIDVCEYHDYSDNNPIPGDQFNGLQVRINQCNELGKPLFVGEIGRIPNQVGGVQARSDIFEDKFDAQFAAGIDGELVWNFHDSLHQDPPSSYGINAGDPVWTMLGKY